MSEEKDANGHAESELSLGVAADGGKLVVKEKGHGLLSRLATAFMGKREARGIMDLAAANAIAGKLAANEMLSDEERFFAIRMYEKDMRRQANNDAVIARTAECFPDMANRMKQLPGSNEHDHEVHDSTSDRWAERVLRDTEDVTDDELRHLYARIIAGECARPRSFSLKTLSVVRDLEPESARLFERAAQYVLAGAQIVPIHVLQLNEVQALAEAGLLAPTSDQYTAAKKVNDDSSVEYYARCGDIVATVRADHESRKPIGLHGYKLTTAGRELMVLSELVPNESIVRVWAAQLHFQLSGYNFVGRLWQDGGGIFGSKVSGVRSWWFTHDDPDAHHEFKRPIENEPPIEFTYAPPRPGKGKPK